MVFCRIPVLENQVNSEFNGRYGSSADDTVHGVQMDNLVHKDNTGWNSISDLFCYHQALDCPTRITSTISTLIDNILTNNQENISQSGTIDTLDFFYKQLV